MIHGFLTLIQKLGTYLRELNEIFYFYIDIDTNISWAVVFLMWLLYKLVTRYFNDQKLTSDELIKLLGIYMVILLAIMASYLDVANIMERTNPEYSFFLITSTALVLVLVLAWGGATDNPQMKKRWILSALYVPILLLILTNGRILEERMDSLKHLLPRTDLPLNLPGEFMDLRVGGIVDVPLVEKIETIINTHKAVLESAIVGHQDEDRFVKPYAFVVLGPAYAQSDELKEDILDYISTTILKNRIPLGMYPRRIQFTTTSLLPRPGKGNAHQRKIEQILNANRKVTECAVVVDDGKIITPYVVLENGITPSRALGKELLKYTLKGIRKNNRISAFLEPRWIKFIKKGDVPRTASGINHIKLQKQVKNWSEVFPNPPMQYPFEE
ncbi:MAG: hypothetical protein B6245_06365 [Desulfobacteraceae bacterium 4572_88]|nr:MAG: hypothetical protein B6245_06365 [Desulfobacteraceae bacterium 4572_88]